MRILVACEESQVVTKELRRLGHEAYSCDIVDQSGGHPEWHIMRDVLPLLNGRCTFETTDGAVHRIPGKWDMIYAFPPCTDLAVSGARHFEKKRKDGRQRASIEFFCAFLFADCPRVVIENPVGIMSGGTYLKTYFPDLVEKYGLPVPYSQIVQPWWFAEDESDAENYHEKTTCLWYRGVGPITVPAVKFGPPERFRTTTGKTFPAWYNKTSLRAPGDRRVVRSKTFPGIGKALAEQLAGAVPLLEDAWMG